MLASGRTHHIVDDARQIDIRARKDGINQPTAIAGRRPDTTLVENGARVRSPRPKQAGALIDAAVARNVGNWTLDATDTGRKRRWRIRCLTRVAIIVVEIFSRQQHSPWLWVGRRKEPLLFVLVPAVEQDDGNDQEDDRKAARNATSNDSSPFRRSHFIARITDSCGDQHIRGRGTAVDGQYNGTCDCGMWAVRKGCGIQETK